MPDGMSRTRILTCDILPPSSIIRCKEDARAQNIEIELAGDHATRQLKVLQAAYSLGLSARKHRADKGYLREGILPTPRCLLFLDIWVVEFSYLGVRGPKNGFLEVACEC